ncbi:MAG TPA: hypothetical protein VGY52_09840 [Roseiarcus sp.]|nr:hypothetical protein [Roseiarcus sp.]
MEKNGHGGAKENSQKNSRSRVEGATADDQDRGEERQEFTSAQEQGEQDPRQARESCACRKTESGESESRGQKLETLGDARQDQGRGETGFGCLKNGARIGQAHR